MRLTLAPQRKQRLAALAMIASLGTALFIGGCGHHNGGDQTGTNSVPSTSQTSGNSTTSAAATDLTATMNDLNASFSGLDTEENVANVDYSSLDQEVQP